MLSKCGAAAIAVVVCLSLLCGTGCAKLRRDKSGFGSRRGPEPVSIIPSGEPSMEELGLRPPELEPFDPPVEFDSVLFDYDRAQIRPAESGKIEAVADYLRRNSDVGVIVEGHCDERGSNEYNLALGERRALAVRAYLIGLGIDGARVQTKSLGEEQPLDPGHSEEAWRVNRRAEFQMHR